MQLQRCKIWIHDWQNSDVLRGKWRRTGGSREMPSLCFGFVLSELMLPLHESQRLEVDRISNLVRCADLDMIGNIYAQSCMYDSLQNALNNDLWQAPKWENSLVISISQRGVGADLNHFGYLGDMTSRKSRVGNRWLMSTAYCIRTLECWSRQQRVMCGIARQRSYRNARYRGVPNRKEENQ